MLGYTSFCCGEGFIPFRSRQKPYVKLETQKPNKTLLLCIEKLNVLVTDLQKSGRKNRLNKRVMKN